MKNDCFFLNKKTWGWRGALFHTFQKLFNVWLHRRLLSFHSYSSVKLLWSVVLIENLASHRYVSGKGRSKLIILLGNCGYFSWCHTAAAAKSRQSCPTLCDPIDGSPPGSSVPGILQARTLEWVAISFSNAWKWKVKVKSLSRVRLFATPWTADHQAPPSVGFSRQEDWSGVSLPSLWCHTRTHQMVVS